MAATSGCIEEGFENPYTEPLDGLEMFTGTIESLGTKSSMNESGQSVWNENDIVGVYAGSVRNCKFILKDNMNTSAVFMASDKVGIKETINRIYAYYPYDEKVSMENGVLETVVPSEQEYTANSFSPGALHMVASATTRSLQFKHLYGIVKLRLANTAFGTVTSIKLSTSESDIIAGPCKVKMDYGEDGPSIVMQDGGTSEITLDCGKGVQITSGGIFFYFVVPAGNYKQLIFNIRNSEGEEFESRSKGQITVNRGMITDAGLATVYIEEFFYGKSNCIQKNEPGTYSFDVSPYFTTDSYGYAYEFNTRENIKSASSADILWQSEMDMISNISLSDDRKTVTFTATKNGNALIGLFDEEGTIIWSFHIWIAPVNEIVYPNGYIVLDRNLGAITNTPGDMKSWGLYYQWGRKDPFPEIASISEPNLVMAVYFDKNNTPAPIKGEPSAPGVNRHYSIKHPTTWLQRTTANNTTDWVWEGGDNGLWGNPEGYKNPDINTLHKSIYDPCPDGYMVTPIKLYTGNGVKTQSSENVPYDAENSGRTLTMNGINQWYPAARQYHHNWPNVTFKSSDITGRYWTSSPANGNIYKALSITWGANNVMFPEHPQFRAFGFNVRCVKETSAQ